MDTDETRDLEIVARLRRLDAGGAPAAPAFDYDGMLARHVAAGARARRRQNLARGMAGALVLALIGASVWRFTGDAPEPPAITGVSAEREDYFGPRIVRADNYLALAALEDHIARVDDALSVARVYAPRGAEVARLERTRAELLDSYSQVRYAELVSANY